MASLADLRHVLPPRSPLGLAEGAVPVLGPKRTNARAEIPRSMTTSCVDDLGFDDSFAWPLKESVRFTGRLALAGPLGESLLEMFANLDLGDMDA